MEFKLFGFEVEIRWSFWLVTLLLGLPGLSLTKDALKFALLWIPIVLVSVLIHELGHAIAIRTRGIEPTISLHGMGGTTSWREVLPISRGWRIIISLAGPFAGFLFGGLVWVVAQLVFSADVQLPRYAFIALQLLYFVNFVWGAVNLLPVLPFDGGHVLEHALGPKRMRITLIVSSLVGAAVCLYGLQMRNTWVAMLFGFAALQTFLQLQSTFRTGAKPKEAPSSAVSAEEQKTLVEARAALEAGEYDLAIAKVESLTPAGATKPASPRAFAQALAIVAWAHALAGRHDRSEQVAMLLGRMGDVDVGLLGYLAFSRGEMQEAQKLLGSAVERGDDRREVFGALIQVELQNRNFDAACTHAEKLFDSLSTEDLRQIAAIAFEGGAFTGPSRILEKIFEREGEKEDAYLAARSAARAGTLQKAKDLLERAVRAGFSDRDRAISEGDLEALRGTGFLDALFEKRREGEDR